MWLYMIVLALVILGLLGGALLGAVFTIVLIRQQPDGGTRVPITSARLADARRAQQ